MGRRTVSAFVGLILFFAVLRFYGTTFFTGAIAILSGMAAYEMTVPTRAVGRPVYGAACAALAFAAPFLFGSDFTAYLLCLGGAAMVLATCTVFDRKEFTFRGMTVCLFAVTAVPAAFFCMTRFGHYLYMVMACVAAWGADVGAYLFGVRYGKTKLCPSISPGKTVEGLVGGLVFSTVLFLGFCWLCLLEFPEGTQLRTGWCVLVGLCCAGISVVGDLFASVIKREYRIKDFGKVMPGHGGILDRFDSVLFTGPVMLCMLYAFPVFWDAGRGMSLFLSYIPK